LVKNYTWKKSTEDNLPPSYNSFEFLFHNQADKKIIDLQQTTVLNYNYKQFLYGSYNSEVTFYIIPDWKKVTVNVTYNQIDQTAIVINPTATVPNLQKQVYTISKRSPIWYYQQPHGVWMNFPNKTNLSLYEAQKKCENFKWKENEITWELNFTTRKAKKTTPPSSILEMAVMDEEQYKKSTNWRIPAIPSGSPSEIILTKESWEWKMVYNYFYLTMPNKGSNGKPVNEIIQIKRLNHPKNWALCEQRIAEVRSQHISTKNMAWADIEYTKLLWHGTSDVSPDVVCEASGAWNVAFASSNNMWGRGIYFASCAGYSDSYAYKTKTGNKSMLLAEVLVGNVFTSTENSAIKLPPPSFDSVVGSRDFNQNQSSLNYVVYDNARSFPAYLVEWRPY